MQNHHKDQATKDRLRQQSNERKKRARWLRSRLPLDDDQRAKVEAQIRKIEERETAERREQRNQRTDAN